MTRESPPTTRDAHPLLNLVSTIFLKLPRRMADPRSRGLTELERVVVESLLSNLRTDDAEVLREQARQINFVDRGVVGDEYQSFFSKVHGVRTVDLSGRRIARREEYCVADDMFLINGMAVDAKLFCTEGELVSLEFGKDVSTFQMLGPKDLEIRRKVAV